MSQNPRKRKASNRKRRSSGQPGAHNPPDQTQPGPSSPAQPSQRASRKKAAQAEAKKKRQLQMLIGGVAAVIVIVAIVIVINRPTGSGVQIDYSDVTVTQSEVVTNRGLLPDDPEDGTVSFATGSTVGDPNAPVTMHIFSDFQCHFCKVFHDETLPKIMDDFVRTGEVQLVFHDFPRLGTDSAIANSEDFTVELMDENNESSRSSQAAMCAGEQDQYLQMSEKLYGNYSGVQSGAFSPANISRFADDLDLDRDMFDACMASDRYVPALADSVEQGASLGITGTPMFILDNGSGDLNVIQQTELGYDMIKRQIEASIQTAP